MARNPIDDSELRDRIREELDWDALVDSANLDVEVRAGVVRLVGTVGSFAEKLAAQDATFVVRGVHDVVNEIVVKPIQEMHPRDDELQDIVRQVLTWDALVPEHAILIDVSDGYVSLSGEVPSQAQRVHTEKVISHLAGVRGVHNHITIATHSVSPDVVHEAITRALTRRAAHRASHIDISIDGHEVTVKGSTQTEAEKRAILGAVGHAPGIRRVLDDLEVDPKA